MIGMTAEHGHQPMKRYGHSMDVASKRFDGIISIEGVRTNCRQCHVMGKKDAKTLFKCEKCCVGLNAQCFKERIRLICLFYEQNRNHNK